MRPRGQRAWYGRAAVVPGPPHHRPEVARIIADFSGRHLVRGGAVEALEGSWLSRAVLVEVPSYADALAFYNSDDYRAVQAIRQRSSDSCLLAMEGLPGS